MKVNLFRARQKVKQRFIDIEGYDFKYIEQLLERYWQCETSLEEEAQLRTFFTEEDVPEHLSRYKDLFVYQQLQQEEHLGADFDARVLAEIEAPVVKPNV